MRKSINRGSRREEALISLSQIALFLIFTSFSTPAADLFTTNSPVLHLKVEISRANIRSLQNEPRRDVPATVREGANVYTNVLVHVKGAAGSYREINDLPSLTLNFGKNDSPQRFHGLRKIHLNNSIQDQSQMTYNICSGMFNDAGVPAARVSNARFTLNGRDMGFYVLVEGFNKDFLKKHFNNATGNFYDGGFLHDINSDLENDTNEESRDRSDLRALLNACMLPDRAQRWQTLTNILDMDRFITFMVLEIFAWDWDGYVMKHNNYRIYNNAGKMTFLPHGMDQMFWEVNGNIYRPRLGGIVARAVMDTPEGSKAYRERLRPVFEKAFNIQTITSRFDAIAKRNRDAVAEMSRGYQNHLAGEMQQTRERIVARWQNINNQLADEPKPIDLAKPARITRWRQQDQSSNAQMDQPHVDNFPTLHIAANGRTAASWRSSVVLDAGHYRFEALARTSKLSALSDQRGEGAGIRISGATQPRRNKLVGETPWTRLQYEFDVYGGSSEVTLICELLATKGEAWFDANSLKLEKLK